MPKISKGKKVFLGMSGGVDSSVAALILKNKGFEVTGVFMRCYNIDNCAERDAEDARRVAEYLKIPFYVWDFEAEYKKRVVDYMIDGYQKGITPNPDIECNREIKFGLFLERALKFGADFVATGHYVKSQKSKVRSQNKNSKFKIIYGLFQAKDKNKDQSYFLWTLTQKQLKHCLFPIGDYLKPEVRAMARQAGLPTADKKDSQGICFLGKVTISDFLKDYLPAEKGLVLNEAGEKIGEHDGAYFYTIGQRQGIGNIKHQRGNKIHKPVYVVSKDVENNTVIVAEEGNDLLYTKEVILMGVNFINKNEELRIRNYGEVNVLARVRYRQPLFEAKLRKIKNPSFALPSLKATERRSKATEDRKKLKIKNFKLVFKIPQKFVAVGQSAVFYEYHDNSSSFSDRSGRLSSDRGELRMLGGGVICA